jgi:hypothetical protein
MALILQRAWKVNSANFAVTEFYEVGNGTPLPLRTFVFRPAVVPPLYY